ncbi:MFS transporter [Streptomyces sp. MUSC 14]|uniref:MFS transporter n=1 Tax=Streptomyces sp. MUSC 14 TaxID=1354889 RepID=UPI0008F5B5AC|nr:MFS transporter [Streptomyces sp. MUSC 14]OIJ93028.1 MFS transporter [Streptomyces sp. MUSC 14]
MTQDILAGPTSASDVPAAPPAAHRSAATGRIAVASMIGSAVEWYDFYLYGTATALVFNKLFFSSLDPVAGILAAFATYAVGFAARPLGAAAAGHFGDRWGRKPVLVVSLFTMGLASALVGALPTYRQAGLLAPVLMVVLRVVQGLAVGAEQGGAAVLTVESARSARRGLWGGFAMSGSSLGLLLSSGAFALTQGLLDDRQFALWGWRVLFLSSLVLVVIGMVLRTTIDDSARFTAASPVERPVYDTLRHHRGPLALAVGMRVSQTAVSYFYTVFVLFYLTDHGHHGKGLGVAVITVSAALSMLSTPGWGALSDRFGRRPVFLFGAVGSALYVVPFFLLVDTGSPVLTGIAVLIGVNVFHDAMFGPQAAWFSELFRTGVRMSGASLGYQTGAVLGGGLLPLLATSLYLVASRQPWLVCAYLLVLSALTVAAALRAPETREHELTA